MREADATLQQLREYVLRPDVVEGAMTATIDLLRPRADMLDDRREILDRQLRGLDDETSRLTAAIAAGFPPPTA